MPRIRPPKQQAETKPEAKPNHNLDEIAKEIKALEKKSIKTVINIGRLLHEASEQCEHGEYMEWLKREFGWSHTTSRRYRSVYEFSQNRQNGEFEKLNVSLSALYCLVDLDGGEHDEEIIDAIIEAAKKGRVSYQMAVQIAKDTANTLRRADEADERKEPESEAQEKGRNKTADTQDDDGDVDDVDDVEDEAAHNEEEDDPEDAPDAKLSCGFALLDIKGGRHRLAKLVDAGHRIPFTISGFIDADVGGVGRDDGVSIEFAARVEVADFGDPMKSAADRAEATAAGKPH